MAKQVAARLKGDDYQHLLAWFHSLELRMERKQVAVVRVEDPDAASADDVTVRHANESLLADRFHQIKFHVTQAGTYSTTAFLDRGDGATSQLEKLFNSWKALHATNPNRPIEIHFVSNWPWSPDDQIGSYISGDDYSLIDGFFAATGRSKVGKLRDTWRVHLKADAAEFAAFCRTLRLKIGFNGWADVAEATADRMDSLGLKSDETALLLAVSVVRGWVKAGQGDIHSSTLESVLEQHNLFLPAGSEPAVHVHLTTIKEQAFDIEPDHTVDWRDHFLGDSHKRGHQLRDSEDWNRLLLPELLDVEAEINQQPARLVRARGKARLCAWFAFGHTFCGPNGYTIEIEQNGQHWRTDASLDQALSLTSQTGDWAGETLRDQGRAVAIGIGVTARIANDVRADILAHRPDVAALLLIEPSHSPSAHAIHSQEEATALAEIIKTALREFCRQRNAKRLLLYYCGPAAVACFIGHRLSAICSEIQVMEYDFGERAYLPSFLLK
jgi:DNA gyrase inhibitor GyrI